MVTLDTEFTPVPDIAQRTPDAEFDRRWAVTVLARGLDVLCKECEMEGCGALFENMKPLLTGDAAHGDQVALAES